MRIAVATDLTNASTDAARYAVTRARRVDADLVVVHVVGSTEIDTRNVVASRYQMTRHSNEAEPLVDDFEHRKIAELRDWFTNAVGIPTDVEVTYAIEFGDLPTVLWNIVGESGADSLVVGAHGTRSVGRHLSRILLDAPIPVVVVREGIL
ncbi:MAG: universal stress protein [Actinomycetota bacterium]